MEMERALIKTYRKDLWVRFIKAVNQYELIDEGDKIAVAISGGKDSLTLAKLFQELKRHGKKHFELEFIAMDPGYKSENRLRLEENCKAMGIPVKVHGSDVFQVANKVGGERKKECTILYRGHSPDKPSLTGTGVNECNEGTCVPFKTIFKFKSTPIDDSIFLFFCHQLKSF